MFNNDNNTSTKLILAVLRGIIIGYISLFLMIVIGALLILVADISDNVAGYFATAFIAISGFLCGYFSAKKFGGRVVIIGFISGLIFYLTVAVISVAITKGGFTSLVLLRMILTVSMAIFGAILSTFKKKKVKIL